MQLQDNECSGEHLVKILCEFGAIVDNISATKILVLEILFLLISLFIES